MAPDNPPQETPRPDAAPAVPHIAMPWRLALLAGFGALILLRLPQAVLHGRFMTEEGTIFFAYAWHHATWDALWRPFGGYLNLAANAVTLLAARLVQGGWLPLEQAPRVTMVVALAFQLLPAALLLFWRPRWITAPLVLIVSLLAMALPTAVEEVWLNVLHIQFHLTLAAALLLALDPPTGAARWTVSAFVLILAPLCGPGAMVLGPLFLARTVLDRSLPRLLQTAMLGGAGLLQLLVFYQGSPMRSQIKLPDEIAAIMFVRLGVNPFVGPNLSDLLARSVAVAHEGRTLTWWLFVAASLLFCGWLALAAWRLRFEARGWLLASGLVLAIATFGFGMLEMPAPAWFVPLYAERYQFVPVALFGLALSPFIGLGAARGNRLAVATGVLPLLLGLVYLNMTLLMFRDGPDWHREVALWRQDHAYQLRSWPSDWTIDLSDVSRTCPRATLASASSRDPSYCETHWLAKLLQDARG